MQGSWRQVLRHDLLQRPFGLGGNPRIVIAPVDLWGLRVRAEVAWACAATESQQAGVQGAGDLGSLVCLERNRNLTDREAVPTRRSRPEVCPHLNRSAAEMPQESGLDKLG